jgi:glycosyltransferase involved in cell wall biosynthesis
VKPGNTLSGLASIIVPCWNQLEFTRHCITALRQHTRRPWELIIIDNGSTDGTKDYVAGVQDMSPAPVTVIANAQNLGFPAAINQGLSQAHGEYLVLLNNDVVVTEGWLEHLIALASTSTEIERKRFTAESIETRKEKSWHDLTLTHFAAENGDRNDHEDRQPATAGIGLVGPMSNYAAPPQLVERVPYSDLEEMHVFARRWREQNRGKWFTVPKLSGFCLLMKRAVYDAIGGLDERFGLGLFDDDDLAERARRAGFELAVAHDVFVHHFGSRTFVGNGVDAEKLLDENQQRFVSKWGLPRVKGTRVALKPFVSASDPRSPAMVRGKKSSMARSAAKISLTMIVRDEENNLPNCLKSVEGVFDEIVIVDTGSTDRTVEIARSFGARVFDFVWVNDFAAARNAALARATGDYAFWLDADDVVDPPQRLTLEALLEGLKAGEEAACVVRCACDPSPDGSGGETVVDHIRLFPVREDVRWTYRVHEQILPALRRANVSVRWTDLTVRHTGYVDRELRRKKLQRDSKILMEELAERSDDPFVLFNLGSIAIELRDWREALEYLRRSLKGSAPTDSITRKLFALIARSHQMLGEPQLALSACASGLEIDPQDAELLFREAVVRRHIGDNGGAERCWRRILGLSRPDQFSSVDQGIYGHLTRRNLAALADERGERGEAVKLWTEVLAECPGDPDARAKLGV